MKIYLRQGEGWKLFDVDRESRELKKRLISLGDGVRLGNGVSFPKSPLQIQGTRHLVQQYTADEIKIGRHIRTLDDWLKNYKKIGQTEGYTESEIEEYGLYLELAKKLMK